MFAFRPYEFTPTKSSFENTRNENELVGGEIQMEGAELTPESLNFGLSSWIIQDGNYKDFSTGQKRRFAIEFYPKQVSTAANQEKSIIHIGECLYEIKAEVLFGNEEAWVLDFGLSAFQEAPLPSNLKVGGYIQGEVLLGVDPFFYFESLFKVKGIPPLIYTWSIERIRMETAPFIETENEVGHKILTRDETKSGLKEIDKTNAWDDDGGNGDYVLTCRKISEEPRLRL